MFGFLLYLLKVSGCLISFYLFYAVFFRNSTFFYINRIYLLFGLIFSFIIPILNYSIYFKSSMFLWPNFADTTMMEADFNNFQIANNPAHVKTINYATILYIIYFAGLSIMFTKLLFSVLNILRLRKNGYITSLGGYKIVKMKHISPFSFFNFIFLPENNADPMIIEHEKTHIKQFHWIDLTLTEITSVLLWFNPFVVLYKSALKLQHEYLADNNAIKNSGGIIDYLNCMLQQTKIVSSGGLTSQFYCKTIKKRITMITKNKTSIRYLGIYFLTVPLVCFLLFAFTSSNENSGTISRINNSKTTVNNNIPSGYPVNQNKITQSSGYGERKHPITGEMKFHYGVDFAAKEGEKVMATADGTVMEAKFDKDKGNYILVKHSNSYSTFYSQLKSIAVKTGAKVQKGQVIGYVGSTGISTGPHLHYEVIKDGKRVNPMDYLSK